MIDLKGKHLTLEFTLTETGVNTTITGNKCGIWVDVLKDVMPMVYKELADSDGPLEQTQDKLIESMAELAGKSVDDVKKELAEMDGDTKANVAKLSLRYLQDVIAKKFAPESKDVEATEKATADEKSE